MFTAEKAVVCRKGRRVRALQNQMFALVNKRRFASCISAPEYKHVVLRSVGNKLYNAVGKPRPAAFGMGICKMFPYGKSGVQKQHALFCPLCQISAVGLGNSQIFVHFFEDVFQRGGKLDPFFNRKTQTVRLFGFVIGVLS